MHKMNKKHEKKKRRIFKTNFIIITTLLGLIIVLLGASWVQNIVLSKERESFYLENKEYIKTDKMPMTYIVMLDNSLSMKNNFKNMNQQLIDCLMVYQSILKENDKMVVFPINWEMDEYIEVVGKDNLDIGKNTLKNIPLFIREENESIKLWTQRVMEYANQLENTEVRVLVITDKSEIELKPLEDIELRRDCVRVITTDLHFENGANDKLLIRKVLDANDFIPAIFNSEFYMHYHRFFSYEFNDSSSLEIQLPEKANRITFLVSGENASLNYVYTQDDTKSIEGNILTESLCLYQYRSAQPIDKLEFYLGGTGKLFVLYPTLNGNELNVFRTETLKEIVYALIFFVLIWLAVYNFLILNEKKKKQKKKIFISYRRDGAATLAHAIAERLRNEQYVTYLDTESLKGEKFNTKLLNEIEESACVVAVLPPGGLDRCMNNENDWVRQELSCAIYNNIQIVPVLINGFTWPEKLPLDISGLQTCNAVIFDEKNYYLESMEKVVEFVEYIIKGKNSEYEQAGGKIEKLFDLLKLEDVDEEIEE